MYSDLCGAARLSRIIAAWFCFQPPEVLCAGGDGTTLRVSEGEGLSEGGSGLVE